MSTNTVKAKPALYVQPARVQTVSLQPSASIPLFFAVFLMAGFAALQTYVLQNGNLAEDAFILYEYVNHVVQGFGISYNSDFQPVEGATDFLWLCLLVLFGFAGVEPPLAAAVLNTLGFGLLGWVIARVFNDGLVQATSEASPQKRQSYPWGQCLAWFFLLLCLLFSHFVFAAVAGFSTALYAGMFALGLKRLSDKDRASFRDIPLIAIALGLFRPDGVLLGVALVLLKGFFALREKCWKPFLCSCLVALGIGVSYFLWRMNYFGELLPLPLYVKSDSDASLAGYYANLYWVYENIHWFLLVGVFLLLSNAWNRLYVLIPGALLFLALMTSTQTQNVGNRFQMPMFIGMVFFLALVWHRVSWRFAQPSLLLVLVGATHLMMCYDDLPKKMDQRLWGQHYVAPFAKLIDPHVDTKTTFAVTEAGRMAYFNDAYIIDLVGLNTPDLAKTRVDLAYLQETSPDLLFFYHDMKVKSPKVKGRELVAVSSEEFKDAVIVSSLYEHDDVRREREIHAASTAVDYLYRANEEYDFFFMYMPEAKDHRHVFAIKKDFPKKASIVDALEQSQRLPSDYFNVIGLN